MTKKAGIVFFNRLGETEKLSGVNDIREVFISADAKLFALQGDEALLEWNLSSILRSNFFDATATTKRSNNYKLDTTEYPPIIHLFSRAVRTAKFILSANSNHLALLIGEFV